MASRKITTRTTFERIKAITNVAHFPIQPRVWSHEAPAIAMGANTIAINNRALRTRRLIHTITAAPIAKPARKIVTIAAAPGATMLSPPRPPASSAIRSPICSIVVPAAWTIPMVSWSVTSSAVASNVIATNDPRIDLASPRAARDRAAGSRRIMPPMTWSMKKPSMTNTATPKRML